MNKKSKTKQDIYAPPDADLNFSNTDSPPPKTEYERRKKTFNRKEVKNLTKGKYGRDK